MRTFKPNYPLIALVLASLGFWIAVGEGVAHALA